MDGQLTTTQARSLQRSLPKAPPAGQVAWALGWFSVGLGMVELLGARGMARSLGMRRGETVIRGSGLREIGTGIGLLTARDPMPWLWGRVAGDALDALTLAFQVTPGNRRRGGAAVALGLVAGVAAVDAWCVSQMRASGSAQARSPVGVRRVVTVARSIDELSRLWRDPATLPTLFAAYAALEPMPDGRTRWTPNGPRRHSWTTAAPQDRGDGSISWRVEPGSDAEIADLSVSMRPAPGTLGTAVTLSASLVPPGGLLGRKVAQMSGGVLPGAMAEAALHYFKALAETGEVPTTRDQPAARADTR